MKRALFAPLLSIALLASMPAFGRPMMLNGTVSQERVSALTNEIQWNTSLYNAEMEARRTGKMIFWVHMLGDMKGATWSAGNSLRAVSLSQDPAFSLLKKYFVCGYHDITNEPYAGVSGRHEVDGNAVDTTNGAGPHNIQMFFLTADGTVLNVLPGYWHSQDLAAEMNLAAKLNQVWLDPHLSRTQKDQMFTQLQLQHIAEHSPQMKRRSRMQGFDMQYEAKNRLNTSDTIADRQAVYASEQAGMKMPPPQAFKTTDEIMHERMANRPFEQYAQFDVASFADYGKPKYDKHEDYRDASGQVDKMAAKNAPLIGSNQAIAKAEPGRARRMMRMQQQYTPGQWGNGGSNGTLWGQGPGN